MELLILTACVALLPLLHVLQASIEERELRSGAEATVRTLEREMGL